MRMVALASLISLVVVSVACATSATAFPDGDRGARPLHDAATDGQQRTIESPSQDGEAADGGADPSPLRLGAPGAMASECRYPGTSIESPNAENSPGYYAVKVKPEKYPFLVESIAYDLWAGRLFDDLNRVIDCLPSPTHKVGFFKGPDGSPPPSNPSDLQTWTASQSPGAGLEVPNPVVLNQGEVGYVMIEVTHPRRAACIHSCSTGATPDTNFVAKGLQPSFNWQNYSRPGNIIVRAQGHEVLP